MLCTVEGERERERGRKPQQMEGIKRAIMDGIGQRFTLRGSGITADQNCSLSVSFRLMTNIWVGPKVFSAYHRLSVVHV